jgi:hypothetical protein
LSDVQAAFITLFNMPGDAACRINGETVTDMDAEVPSEGDVVEFVKPMGEKGS